MNPVNTRVMNEIVAECMDHIRGATEHDRYIPAIQVIEVHGNERNHTACTWQGKVCVTELAKNLLSRTSADGRARFEKVRQQSSDEGRLRLFMYFLPRRASKLVDARQERPLSGETSYTQTESVEQEGTSSKC